MLFEPEQGLLVLAGNRDELRTGEVIGALASGVGDGGGVVGAPDLDVAGGGEANLDALFQSDGPADWSDEIFPAPEVVGSFGLGANDVDLVLKTVAGSERADGDLFFLEIGVERSFAGDGRGLFLRVGGRGLR